MTDIRNSTNKNWLFPRNSKWEVEDNNVHTGTENLQRNRISQEESGGDLASEIGLSVCRSNIASFPGHRPAFHRLQYGEAGRGPGTFPHVSMT